MLLKNTFSNPRYILSRIIFYESEGIIMATQQQKISNTQMAYYKKDLDSEKQLITIADAELRIENGFSLRGRLFDIEAFDKNGEYVPVKYVGSLKQASYFAVKAETTAKKGTSNTSDKVHCSESDLHEFAKNSYEEYINNGGNLMFEDLLVANGYITNIDVEKSIAFYPVVRTKKPSKDGVVDTDILDVSDLKIIRPDVTINTTFINIFIEITVTNGMSDDKLKSYRDYDKYRRLNRYIKKDYGYTEPEDFAKTNMPSIDFISQADMPFIVVEITLNDLVEKCKIGGLDSVKAEVLSRLFNSKYSGSFENNTNMFVYRMTSFYQGGAPFGYSSAFNPFVERKLVVNTGVNTISTELRSDLVDSCLKNYISIKYFPKDDEGNPITGTDAVHCTFIKSKDRLRQLNCPVHTENSLVLVKQSMNDVTGKINANRGKVFFKCEQYQSETTKGMHRNYEDDDTTNCEVTVCLCDRYGIISAEFIAMDDIVDFSNGCNEAYNRVRDCQNSYRECIHSRKD
jgi:hypothetical protein